MDSCAGCTCWIPAEAEEKRGEGVEKDGRPHRQLEARSLTRYSLIAAASRQRLQVDPVLVAAIECGIVSGGDGAYGSYRGATVVEEESGGSAERNIGAPPMTRAPAILKAAANTTVAVRASGGSESHGRGDSRSGAAIAAADAEPQPFERQTVDKDGLKLVIFVRDRFVCIESRRVAERAVREGAVAVNGVSAVGVTMLSILNSFS
jgi:hypothetical protein